METDATRTVTVSDGTVLHVYVWDGVEQPRAVIQLLHGMAEHAARYEDFAKAMNKLGFICCAADHRGHGKTAGSVEKLGFLGEDGFNRVMSDAYELTELIKTWHPGLPVFLLGHSFGSFIAQEYITHHGGAIQGLILSGSGKMDGLQVSSGRVLATLMAKLMNESKQSPFLRKLSFGGYNKRIENPQSENAWLSRDASQVQKYDQDPYCGTVFTINFYKHFLTGLSQLYRPEKLEGIPKKLPILIVSGSMDPVGQYGTGPTRLEALYKGMGLDSVNLTLYRGYRHEIINETNRDEVFRDIGAWINGRLKAIPK